MKFASFLAVVGFALAFSSARSSQASENTFFTCQNADQSVVVTATSPDSSKDILEQCGLDTPPRITLTFTKNHKVVARNTVVDCYDLPPSGFHSDTRTFALRTDARELFSDFFNQIEIDIYTNDYRIGRGNAMAFRNTKVLSSGDNLICSFN